MGSSSSVQRRILLNRNKFSQQKSVKQLFEDEFKENELYGENLFKSISNNISNHFHLKRNALASQTQEEIVVQQTQLLHDLFMGLYPSINSASFNYGEVKIAAKYMVEEQILHLKFIQVKRLLKRDAAKLPDPFAVVDLFQISNPLDIITRKTSVKFSTCDPVYQEVLTFQLNENEVPNTCLHITLKDNSNLTSDECLGEITLTLSSLDIKNGRIMWLKLMPKTDSSIMGFIDVTITINQPNSLVLTIHRAKGMSRTSPLYQLFVRQYITGFPQKFQTKLSSTTEPIWEESFKFEVHTNELKRRIIVLEVYNQDGKEDIYAGGVYIPLEDFNMNWSGEQRTYSLQDLRNMGPPRSKWSKEGIGMELQESTRAHITYGVPAFLTKKEHRGTKIITLVCEKANAQAKVLLINGIPSKQAIVL